MSEESVGDAGASSLGYFGGCFSPQHALGGHYGAVVDMPWDAPGRCLHTDSEDQTSRIFSTSRAHWCEIARPQVSLMTSSGLIDFIHHAKLTTIVAEAGLYQASLLWIAFTPVRH